jgi:ABC-2 type transport system permease protein
MLAIFKRELFSALHNVTGFLYIGITLALYGLYFFTYNLSMGYPYIAYSMHNMMFVFVFTVPILTMRVLADEKKSRTDQLLLTAPISINKIMFGKFMALAVMHTIVVAVICISPIFLNIFGDVPLLETYVGILGFWLFGLVCIAIGMFASSLCENVIISAIIAFVLLYIGYSMKSFTSGLSSNGNMLTKILNCYDIYSPIEKFYNGIFSITNIVYYVSLILLFVFLSCQSWQKRRWTISKNMISTSVFSVITIVIVIAAVIGFNFGISKLPSIYTDFDTTNQRLYALTSESKKYLKTIDKDVNIYVLVPEASKDANVDKTLTYIKDTSKHIKLKYVDVTNDASFTQKYSTSEINANSIIVECGDKYKIIDYGSQYYQMTDSQIYQYDIDYNAGTIQVSGYDCEGQVVSAIQYVLSESENVENPITIDPKDYTVSSVQVTVRSGIIYGLIWGLLMPFVLIIVGIIIWIRRRKL